VNFKSDYLPLDQIAAGPMYLRVSTNARSSSIINLTCCPEFYCAK
jgi:hypothetical protein